MTDDTDRSAGKPLTGRKVLAMFVIGFGLIIGVNLFMAYNAISTFPGMEVSSSYADSQTFDDRRLAQEELGWNASVAVENGVLNLTLVDSEGRPVYPAELDALLTRPTSQRDDQRLDFARGPNGVLTAPVALAEGQWRLRLTGKARNGADYRHNITFSLRD
ncbi:Type cbb3 cytochrome oxidase biogenesis protein CcoH [Roseibacterium elongatum DSM 19469]|uniref:Type cbb3 cytochrome oxidase biogenesis protein CcoH n=1 Tax=Roseicyclus elongatus DSM 19469 TaxID=1294273 RepID=W8RPI1_9RHOB|nr:FixH family protein [Roseibacterium elongatum]AHM03069.1 Type cbb3 cytochrome oxidase biogenesis protein CcoH [Roseibacterium elongatum DSM 19469]